MENVLHDESMLDLQIDASASDSLENGSWWAKFIAIVFIACIALGAIGIAIGLNAGAMDQIEYNTGVEGLSSAIWVVFALALLIVGLFIALLLSFASKTSRAVRESDQQLLESGIGSLKTYLIVLGVFSMLGLLITLLGTLSL